MSAAQEMTAAVLHGKEDIRIERVPVPEAAAGEIVIKVGAALTCGTDLKVYRRGYHAKMLVPPALFGHEVAGTVHALGEGVTRFALGDRVVALNSAPCDACFYCERKQWNLCDNIIFNNGAYAEFIRIPARIMEKNTLAIPAGVPFEHAALTEPLACVVRGLDECEAAIETRPGDTVAVIGAGPIGLMFMHAAQIAGYRVIAVVKRDEQIEAAKTFGAAEVLQTTQVEDVVAAVRALTPDGRGVDMAIEAVATPATWEWAVDMVRKGGVVNFFGGCAAGTKVSLDTNRLHYNDIKLLASFHHTPVTARKAFALVTGGQFKCAEYITGRARLAELDSVFKKLMSCTNDIKTAILP